MIKGIIFDMDGVMIDTENQSNLGWLWAASQKNVEMPLWLIDSFKGAPAKLSKSFFDDYYHGEQDYWEMRTNIRFANFKSLPTAFLIPRIIRRMF